jgi:glycosyltransferase involved in cell wall biosynthesis
MNIAWYSHYCAPEIGAPSARIYDLSRNWLNMGHKVQVVTCFPNHPIGKLYPGYNHGLYMKENLDGIDVHRNWSYITPNKGVLKKTLGHVSFLPSAFILGNRHLTAPDLVIGTSPTFFAAMAAGATGIKRNVPFIMEIRDLWPAIFVELGVLKNHIMIRMLEHLELALYHKAVRVVTVTESFRKDLIARGIASSKVVTIPNGADTKFWQPVNPDVKLRRELGLEKRFIVLYIGAHGISHALGRVLESAQRLQNISDIHFLFVGEGAQKNHLIRQAQRARLNNIAFLEPVDKAGVKAFYSIADACLVPLRNIPLFEKFIPSKMFEIMAMGRPIVASIRGEPADIINRSGGGIVVEPEDSEAIAQAVRLLYQNRKQREAMGETGRRFVSMNYSRAVISKKYLQVIHEAIEDFKDKIP